jgi:ankyrin repeat protein
MRGTLRSVRFYTESLGASPFRYDRKGYTAFHLACMHNNLPVLQYLVNGHLNLANTTLLNPPFENGTLLHWVVDAGHHAMVKYLLSFDDFKDVLEHETLLGTPLEIAAHYGHYKVARILVDAGATVTPLVRLILEEAPITPEIRSPANLRKTIEQIKVRLGSSVYIVSLSVCVFRCASHICTVL